MRNYGYKLKNVSCFLQNFSRIKSSELDVSNSALDVHNQEDSNNLEGWRSFVCCKMYSWLGQSRIYRLPVSIVMNLLAFFDWARCHMLKEKEDNFLNNGKDWEDKSSTT